METENLPPASGAEGPAGAAPAATSPDRAPDLALLERVERELADVEAVLPALDDGTYGTCRACGQPIADERLAESPATRTCSDHQSER